MLASFLTSVIKTAVVSGAELPLCRLAIGNTFTAIAYPAVAPTRPLPDKTDLTAETCKDFLRV